LKLLHQAVAYATCIKVEDGHGVNHIPECSSWCMACWTGRLGEALLFVQGSELLSTPSLHPVIRTTGIIKALLVYLNPSALQADELEGQKGWASWTDRSNTSCPRVTVGYKKLFYSIQHSKAWANVKDKGSKTRDQQVKDHRLGSRHTKLMFASRSP
jgi:hypothetical protein